MNIIDFKSLIFYIFAFLALISSIAVVASRNPVRSVLSLVLTFVLSAITWVILGAPFLALSLIVVYVGAVMVLFLFVVMMLDIEIAEIKEGFNQHIVLTGIVVFVMAGFLIYFATGSWFSTTNFPVPAMQPASYNNLKELGLRLFSNYLYQFEVAGELLTAAVVAAVALAFNGAKKRKKQNISMQVRVTKDKRLKLVDL